MELWWLKALRCSHSVLSIVDSYPIMSQTSAEELLTSIRMFGAVAMHVIRLASADQGLLPVLGK